MSGRRFNAPAHVRWRERNSRRQKKRCSPPLHPPRSVQMQEGNAAADPGGPMALAAWPAVGCRNRMRSRWRSSASCMQHKFARIIFSTSAATAAAAAAAGWRPKGHHALHGQQHKAWAAAAPHTAAVQHARPAAAPRTAAVQVGSITTVFT
eukprot:1159792-Pelagomonas_calceolata.AAC.24